MQCGQYVCTVLLKSFEVYLYIAVHRTHKTVEKTHCVIGRIVGKSLRQDSSVVECLPMD